MDMSNGYLKDPFIQRDVQSRLIVDAIKSLEKTFIEQCQRLGQVLPNNPRVVPKGRKDSLVAMDLDQLYGDSKKKKKEVRYRVCNALMFMIVCHPCSPTPFRLKILTIK